MVCCWHSSCCIAPSYCCFTLLPGCQPLSPSLMHQLANTSPPPPSRSLSLCVCVSLFPSRSLPSPPSFPLSGAAARLAWTPPLSPPQWTAGVTAFLSSCCACRRTSTSATDSRRVGRQQAHSSTSLQATAQHSTRLHGTAHDCAAQHTAARHSRRLHGTGLRSAAQHCIARRSARRTTA